MALFSIMIDSSHHKDLHPIQHFARSHFSQNTILRSVKSRQLSRTVKTFPKIAHRPHIADHPLIDITSHLISSSSGNSEQSSADCSTPGPGITPRVHAAFSRLSQIGSTKGTGFILNTGSHL